MAIIDREPREPFVANGAIAVAAVPLEEAFTADVLALAVAITAAWRETLEGIFKTGDLLIQAKASVRHGQWQRYVETNLPFKVATARRLMAIANDTKLRKQSHAHVLPICWFTLWDLTTLTDEQFERGIQSGEINPDMQRVDVEALKGNWTPATSAVWMPGAFSSPRVASRRGRDRRTVEQEIAETQRAYFHATRELSADESERHLEACRAHFRFTGYDYDEDGDGFDRAISSGGTA